jgi:GABA(A) receptor-associated protein
MSNSFKQTHSFEARKGEVEKILRRNPDRIPIVAERHPSSTLPDIDRKKFLVAGNLKVSQFSDVLRKRIALQEKDAFVISVNGMIADLSEVLSDMYAKYKDEDGFLYLMYHDHGAFGGSD